MMIQTQDTVVPFGRSARRLYCESIRICNVRGLRREWNGSRSGERDGEPREHHEVGVKRDPLKPANPQGGEPELVLQSPELSFYGGSTPGQRHFDAFHLKSAPAKFQVPCSHSGARWSPRLTPMVLRRGMIGTMLTGSQAS